MDLETLARQMEPDTWNKVDRMRALADGVTEPQAGEHRRDANVLASHSMERVKIVADAVDARYRECRGLLKQLLDWIDNGGLVIADDNVEVLIDLSRDHMTQTQDF